jgi:hypothetical protein
VLDSQNSLNHADGGLPVRTTQNAHLEAHWSFLIHGGKEVDYLYVDFYNGDAGSPSTLSLPVRPAIQKVLEPMYSTSTQ